MKWFYVALLITSLLPHQLVRGEPRQATGDSQRPPLCVGDKLVVIDPGHGGTNLGAPGAVEGIFEKELTLAYARQLADLVRGQGHCVRLTRTDDRYLSLRQRVGWANQIGADLLVSIHLNATEAHTQRGFETFILTPAALDVDARALRASEGIPRPGLDDDVSELLDDIERGVALTGAAELAAAIQREMRSVRGRELDRGVRQASMDVLLGAAMPAVLTEVGFIDHAREGLEMVDPEVRTAICEALARAIVASL